MSTTFDSHTAKFLSAVSQNMPKDMSGDVMQGWIENPKGLQKALRLALCPPAETVESEAPKAPELKIWKRIKLGTGLKTADEFRTAIKDNSLPLGKSASNILGKIAFAAATEEQEVDLVRMSVEELGFNKPTRYSAICARAKELGLELCPAEVGPQLRLQYLDQPLNELLIIAMEAIRDALYGDHLYLFHVGHGFDGRWLRTCGGHSATTWSCCDRDFVFVSCKK